MTKVGYLKMTQGNASHGFFKQFSSLFKYTQQKDNCQKKTHNSLNIDHAI